MLHFGLANLRIIMQTAKQLKKYLAEMVAKNKDELKKMQWFVYSSKKM